MKKLIIAAVALAAAIAGPSVAMAQTANGPMTRAEVRSQLVQLERAGYNPAGEHTTYPAGIQAAERRVQGEPAYSGSAGASIYGSSRSGYHNATNSSRGEANAYGNVNGIDFSRP